MKPPAFTAFTVKPPAFTPAGPFTASGPPRRQPSARRSGASGSRLPARSAPLRRVLPAANEERRPVAPQKDRALPFHPRPYQGSQRMYTHNTLRHALTHCYMNDALRMCTLAYVVAGGGNCLHRLHGLHTPCFIGFPRRPCLHGAFTSLHKQRASQVEPRLRPAHPRAGAASSVPPQVPRRRELERRRPRRSSGASAGSPPATPAAHLPQPGRPLVITGRPRLRAP